ncbi:MAG: DUF481 domain-containing protein [Lentimonas sp.]
MILPRPIQLLALLIGEVVCLSASPKVVSLESGERVVGDLLDKSTDGVLYLQSRILGEIAIPRERVVKLEDQIAVAEVVKPAKLVVGENAPTPGSPKDAAPEKQIAYIGETVDSRDEPRVIDSLWQIKAPDYWKGNVRLGLNISQGNRRWTESFVRGNLEIDPKNAPNFYRLNGSYTYRETERSGGTSVKSTDKYDAAFVYRRTFHENWFVQNAVGYRVDQIKGIDRELQEAVGIGYRYKPNNQFDFVLGGGGGVENFEADFEDSRDGLNPVMNVFQEAKWRPLNRTSLTQKFHYYWNPKDVGQFNYMLTAAIRFRVTDLIGLEFSYKQDFDNDTGTGDARDDRQWRNAVIVYF